MESIVANHQHICLPNGILKSLKKGNTHTKQKIQKALIGLRDRPFPHSLFVKKLRGTPDVILEARINKSQRLLFDFISRYCEDCQKIVPYTRILEYVPDHDDVARTARRLNLDIDDSRFQDWENIPSEEIDPKERETVLDYYANKIDCVKETIESSYQWYVFNDKEFEQFITEKNRDLRLLLTADQAKLLKRIGPTIINGSAGSGKTTLGIYYLLKVINDFPGLRALYVTYNNSLLTYSKKLFFSLCPNGSLAQGLGKPGVHFATYRQLCCEIAKGQSFEEQREETYLRFKKWLGRFPIYSGLDPAMVWAEIRSVIRGSIPKCEPSNDDFIYSDMVSKQDYLDIGGKSTRIGSVDIRSVIYEIGIKYDEHLKEENRYDEMSMTRSALRSLRNPLCDVMVVDEVQDLTELQLELLLRLVPKYLEGKNLFLTGDLQQVINPSSFRWENVRYLFYSRGWQNFELLKLNLNFRCRGPITRLANVILEQRQKSIGRYSDETIHEIPTDLEGDPPFICWEDENKFIEELRHIDVQGIDIIARTEAIRDQLKNELNSTAVWTIEETKGLEFKDVILWKLTDPEECINFKESKKDKNIYGPLSETAHEYNKIYVAVTRARRTLAIFEKSGNVNLWKEFLDNGYIREIELQDVNNHLNLQKTQQEWLERANYLFEQKKFEQAAQAFDRTGEVKNREISLAHHFLSIDSYADAAKHFEKVDYFLDAAESWEKGKNYRRAARNWVLSHKYDKGGACWFREGQYKRAAVCMQLAEMWSKAGNCWYLAGRFKDAAICFDKAGNSKRAGECYKDAGEFDKAIERGIAVGPDEFANYYERKGEYRKAAQLWQDIGYFDKAALNWRHCNEIHKEANCWELAAENNRNSSFYYEAARCYLMINEVQKALKSRLKGLELDEEWNAAGKIAKKLGDLKLARRYYGKAESYCAVRKIDRQLKKQNRRTLDSKSKGR